MVWLIETGTETQARAGAGAVCRHCQLWVTEGAAHQGGAGQAEGGQGRSGEQEEGGQGGQPEAGPGCG